MDNLQLPSPQQQPNQWQQLLQQYLRAAHEFVQLHRTPLLAVGIFLGGNLTGWLIGQRPRAHSVKVSIAKSAPAMPASKASKAGKSAPSKIAKASGKKAVKTAKKSRKGADSDVFAGR